LAANDSNSSGLEGSATTDVARPSLTRMAAERVLPIAKTSSSAALAIKDRRYFMCPSYFRDPPKLISERSTYHGRPAGASPEQPQKLVFQRFRKASQPASTQASMG